MTYLSLKPLEDLWSSTEELFKRFDLQPTLDAQSRKFFEEIYEFTSAVTTYWVTDNVDPFTEGYDIRPEIAKNAVAELTDAIVVGMALCMKLGIQFEQLQDAFEFVIDKNDAKTPYTHEVIDGMIIRK